MNWLRTILTTATEGVTEATQQTTQGSSLDSMVSMLDILLWVMLLGYGAYALYTAIRLRRTYMLFANKFLYPGNCSMDTCLDEDGFIDYILPRITAWGCFMVLFGILFMVNTYVIKLSGLWVDLAAILLPVGSVIWYMFIQRKAAKLYWEA